MLQNINSSLVQSISLYSYQVNRVYPCFHAEAFEVSRVGPQLRLARRHSDHSTVVTSNQVDPILAAICQGEPAERFSPGGSLVGPISTDPRGVRLRVQLSDGKVIIAESFENWGDHWRIRVQEPRLEYVIRNAGLREAIGDLFGEESLVGGGTRIRRQQSSERNRLRQPIRTTVIPRDELPRPKQATEVEQPLVQLELGAEPARRITEIVAAGGNINAVDHRGRTALYQAIRYEKRRIVELLLEFGATPNISTNEGETAINLACRCAKSDEDLAIIKRLIDAGADVSSSLNILFNAPRLTSAARGQGHRFGEEPLVSKLTRLLLAAGANVDARDESGFTGLMHSAGSPQIMSRWIEAGADVNARAVNGMTPLMLAAGSLDCLKLLIKNGASVNDVDSDGRTVLIHAARIHFVDPSLIGLLLSTGADASKRDTHDMTASDYASANEIQRRIENEVRLQFKYSGIGDNPSNLRVKDKQGLEHAAEVCRLLKTALSE